MPVISKSNPVNWGHPLNKGRVAWWKCLDSMGTGTVWRDIAKGRHATLVYGSPFNQGATPTSAKGSPGKLGAMRFDRVDDLGRTDDHPSFAITSQITLGAYAYITTTGAYQHIIVKPSSGAWSGTYAVWALRVNNADVPQAWINDASVGGNYVTAAASIGANRWYRLIFTYDGTTLRIYVDGVQSSSTSLSTSISTSTYQTFLGSNTVGSDLFGGLLDDVFISNRAWSANEVAQDYTLSRLGYPGVLNRISPTVYFLPVSSSTGNWHYYQQQHALMGAA